MTTILASESWVTLKSFLFFKANQQLFRMNTYSVANFKIRSNADIEYLVNLITLKRSLMSDKKA